jgi:hypothetical protein
MQMTDHHTRELDHYQGLVDQLADEETALEKYRDDFAEMLMQEYTEDNHGLSRLVADWLSEEGTPLEGHLFSVLTNPDFDMGEVWRDWLTDKFVEMAGEMSSKEIDDFQEEHF